MTLTTALILAVAFLAGFAFAVIGGGAGWILRDYLALAREVRSHLATFRPKAAPPQA